MMNVRKRSHDIKGVPKHVIENFYYNWHCGMANSFNGTPYPRDYPREVYDVGGLTSEGVYMTFGCLDKYCKERGINFERGE